MVYRISGGVRGVVIGHFVQAPAFPLLGVDFGEGIELLDPICVSLSPPPDSGEEWRRADDQRPQA